MSLPPVITQFNNSHNQAPGRHFPGLQAPHGATCWLQSPQTACHYRAEPGDIFRITGHSTTHPPMLAAFGPDGSSVLRSMGLTPGEAPPREGFDPRAFTAWLAARGATDSPEWAPLGQDEDGTLILHCPVSCDLWLIAAVPEPLLVQGTDAGVFEVRRQRANTSVPLLPEPLGEIRDEFTVRRGSAQAYELAKGDVLQIIDIEGQQCSDFVALSSAGLDGGRELTIDSTATRSMVRRSYPGPGLFDKFFNAEMEPMLRVLQDTCGRHDTFGLACTARGYADRGFPGHLNCSDNISAALAPSAVQRRNAWPAINFFWNTWIDAHSHGLMTEESWSRPGDFVTLEALEPLVCVSTACPDDIDPINGWNPTDIHVRIYRGDTPVRRAVAYREKEDAPMTLSQESPFHGATSKLTRDFAPARNLWLPHSFTSVGTVAEYWACRTAATLQDMSGLRKYDVIGPDAEALLQRALTKDVARIALWRGVYGLMCDDQGAVIDDGTLFRLAPQLFRWCCGTEESARHLQSLATGLNVRINAMGDALPSLALQGPASRDILRSFVFTQPQVPALDDLKWFGVTTARVGDRNGLPFMLSRTGFTGELGYELFCAAADGEALWDTVMEAGAPFGLKPMGAAALEILRIEAGFAAAGAEFAPSIDAFEAGLGFAVDLRKADFVGKAALERNQMAPRRVLKGLLLDQDDVPPAGATVYAGERPVGVVTSATRSPTLERAVAIARLAVEKSADGTPLQVGQMDGHFKRLDATVAPIPFIDPAREKARS